MNGTYRLISMVLGEMLRMTHSLCLTIIAFVSIAGMLALPAAPAKCSEIYTSANSDCPHTWDNLRNSCFYHTARMDAVYFAGREVVFFTQDSDCIVSRSLYYYAPGYSTYGYVTLFDDQNNDPWFKTVVFNNILYIFYTNGNDTISYRTVTVDYGTPEKPDWKLTASGVKSLPAGISSAKIRSAVVMNGQLYIIYSDNGSTPRWYYLSSADGLKFGSGTLFFTSPGNYPSWFSDATVFMVPDAKAGFQETLMIAYYVGGSNIYYFFFNGEIAYGHWYVNTGLSDVRSVRLFTGTAEDYTNNKYVIQTFLTTPTSSSGWDHMYHGEYTPSGSTGEMGSWRSTWTELSLDSHDQVYDLHEPNWAIIPYYTEESPNQRMKLRIWYSKDTYYTYTVSSGGYQTVRFRSSTYKSDLLEHADDTLPPQDAGMSAYPLLGVIQGTPPYPVNNGVPTADSAGTSTVVLQTGQTVTFATTWTATAGTAVSFGKKFGPVNTLAKLSAGVKHSKESTNGKAVYQTDTLQSYNYLSYPGGLAWVLFLKPEILTDQYILKGFDGSELAYDGDTTDELRVSLITYGQNTTLAKMAFYIDRPSDPMGGTDTTTAIFSGMAPMPKSSNVCAWDVAVTPTDSYTIPADGHLPALQSTQGDRSTTTYTQTTTNAVTNGFNAGFSASAGALGFTAEGNVNFSMDFKTTTAMTQSLGFGYAVPACGGPDSTTACISSMTVYPYILVPNDDETGYNAPWITHDIRDFHKPKPWAITYSAIPGNPSACTATNSLAATRIAVQKVQGTLLLDESKPLRDKLSAKISLIVPPDFVMNQDEWLHLRVGNYFADSNRLQVISRKFEGNNLVLKLKGPNPDSSITARLSFNRNKSVLDIDLDADRVDLTSLHAYRFLEAANPSVKAETVPVGLYIGGKYFAGADADILCAIHDQNVTCNFHDNN